MNESITVRSEKRAIYTLSRNLTVQIYVGSSDTDLGTSDLNRKHCSHRVRSPHAQVNVGTPDKCWDFRWSGLPTYAGTSDMRRQPTNQQCPRCRDSRHGSGLPTGADNRPAEPQVSGLPTWVGTSDCREFRLTSGLPTSTVTAQAVTGSQRFRQESRLPTVGSSGLRRDFRHRQSQKNYSMCS